jgi:hypothetical protein
LQLYLDQSQQYAERSYYSNTTAYTGDLLEDGAILHVDYDATLRVRQTFQGLRRLCALVMGHGQLPFCGTYHALKEPTAWLDAASPPGLPWQGDLVTLDDHPDVIDAFCAEEWGQLWLHVANTTTTVDAWAEGRIPR